MNIIIPLCGKGERFLKNGYNQPKPLIKVFEKTIIEYVLDNLNIVDSDNVFIIYNTNLDKYDFKKFLNNKYPFLVFIGINQTKGAAETLMLGIEHILDNNVYSNKCLVLDCDTFYKEDILSIFRYSNENIVFYTKNYDNNPIYSYITLDNNNTILDIKEKEKISDNANTGAYAFNKITLLYEYCKYVVENNITFNNEYYTSCVISEMIKKKELFKGYKLDEKYVFSLGTPSAVNEYINNTHSFLFDLDGTLVKTDDIYYNIWCNILSDYNILLTKDMFSQYIQGNNDKYILNNLLINVDININYLSQLKDDFFIENINKIIVIDGLYDILSYINSMGHKISIVTNCNKRVAISIIKHINIENFIDLIISADDCELGKPSSEPYQKAIDYYGIYNKKVIIFEDSKTGILSGKGVDPKLLIGIETNYTNEELLKYGVDFTLKNYLNLDINSLFNFHKVSDIKNSIFEKIKKNTSVKDIKDILIDNSKLKGGFIADVIGFKIVTYNGTTFSQILKYENQEENNLSTMAKKIKLYEREYYFYTDISHKINIKIPNFYNLITDDQNITRGIVLENLLEKNYKLNLDLNVEQIDVTLKIIDRMAKMHSSFWNKDLKKMFPNLKNSRDEIFYPFFAEFINERYELFKTRWCKTLNKNQIKICGEIFNNFSDIQFRFSCGNNLTFIHGDIKSPNIFYDVENNYEPYFIDWQHCAIGKGVQDLIFFIIESFNISNLKLIFNISKNYYYKKLLEYGVLNYTFKEYETDIYDAICYIPFFTSIWFGTTPQDELIDKNFPYFFISKLFYLIEIVK